MKQILEEIVRDLQKEFHTASNTEEGLRISKQINDLALTILKIEIEG